MYTHFYVKITCILNLSLEYSKVETKICPFAISNATLPTRGTGNDQIFVVWTTGINLNGLHIYKY